MSPQPHRATSALRRRPGTLGLLVGLTTAAAIVVPSTLAAGKAPPPDKTPPASQTTPQHNSCPGGAPPAITSAIARLDHAGTIDQAQTQAIDATLKSECSLDPQQLIDNRTITPAQAQAVNEAITHAKMALATGAQSAKDRRQAHTPRTVPDGATTTIASRHTKDGVILVGPRRQTLFLFLRDQHGTSTCYRRCARAWPPLRASGRLTAKPGSGVKQRWLSTTRRRGGIVQVTYDHWPLYVHAGNKPGSLKGNDTQDFGSYWYAMPIGGVPRKR